MTGILAVVAGALTVATAAFLTFGIAMLIAESPTETARATGLVMMVVGGCCFFVLVTMVPA